MRILLVDDNDDLRQIVYEILIHHGIDVEVSSSAAEALERLENGEEYNIVVTDLWMPGIDGWELARIVKETYQLCCVAITSFHNRVVEFRANAEESDFVAYYQKPIDEVTFAQDMKDIVAGGGCG